MINNLLKKFSTENDISSFLEIIKYYRFSGNPEAAENFIKEYGSDFENDCEVKFERANIYVALNRINEAVKLFEQLLNNESFGIYAVNELVKIYKQNKEYKKAVDALDTVIKANKENIDLYKQKIVFQKLIPDGQAVSDTFKKLKSLQINSDDIFVKNIENVEKSRRFEAPYRCVFTWGMHYKCNYDCVYCYAPKTKNRSFVNNENNIARYESVENITDSWKTIYDLYGSSRIRLDGGEPSVYPGFFKILEKISTMHRLQVNTNLSFDINNFCDIADPDTVKLDASLHCEYVKLDDFIKKLEILKSKKYKLTVSFVAYPDFLENVPLAKKAVEKLDIPFFVHPYSGFYNEKQYPLSYTEAEKKYVYDIDTESITELEWRQERKSNYKNKNDIAKDTEWTEEEKEKFKKLKEKHSEDNIKQGVFKICEMGRMYARIYPNGNSYRCCASDGNTYLGNLYDKTVKLLDKPERCYDIKDCRCWRCMIPGEEDRWLHTWMDDWEMEIL